MALLVLLRLFQLFSICVTLPFLLAFHHFIQSFKYGLKIVLDLHKCCGYVFDNAEYCSFFTDPKLQDMFKSLWLEFTRRYGKEEIMAFELLNEVTEYWIPLTLFI